MGLYTLGFRTTVATSGAAAAEIRVISGERRRLRELTVTLAAATASTYGLGRPAAIGVTPTAPITFLPQDPADNAGTTTAAVAWATGPTVPVQFLRRLTLPATIGAGLTWYFGPYEFVIGQVGGVANAVTSLVLWNLALNSAATDITAVVEE